MRKMMMGAAALLAAATTVNAQAPNKAAVEKQLIANENAVNEAIAKHDLAGFKKHVPSESWAVDPGGPMTVAEFEKNFTQVKFEPGWKIDQSKVVWIDDNAAVHFYRWTGKGSFGGQPFGDTYSSTVWANRGGSWVALFHQETPIAAPPPAPVKK
jgi:hypothetical protein